MTLYRSPTERRTVGLAQLRVLTKLKMLNLNNTEITDAGCATLAAALDSGVLPALSTLHLQARHACPPRSVSRRHEGTGAHSLEESRHALRHALVRDGGIRRPCTRNDRPR